MGVNLLAVLVAALATMVVGFLWYSPLLFAKPWTVLMGYDPNDKAKMGVDAKGAGGLYSIALLLQPGGGLGAGRIIHIATIHSVLHGLRIGAGVWLGFVTTTQLTDKLFTQTFQLYLINTGYQLACFLAMEAFWRLGLGNRCPRWPLLLDRC